MRQKIWYGVLLALLLPIASASAQVVGDIMWEDNFNDVDTLAQYDVGWFYYHENDGLMGAVVEQRENALYFLQGSFTILGAVIAGTNGVPQLEVDANGDLTDNTKEDLLANDFSKPNQEGTFQVKFRNITSSWFIMATRMLQDSDHIDSDPTMSPGYLVYISPLEGQVGLAKVPQVQYAMLDPTGYQWLANPAPFTFQLETFYWVKFYLFESEFKVKVWQGEAADEPATWLIETVDPDPRVSGEYTYFGLLNPNAAGTDEMLVDNVTLREVNTGDAVAAEPAEKPVTFGLRQNYPNPFNPATEIEYTTAKTGEISLAVYDQSGRLVRQLVNCQQTAGEFRVLWDGLNSAGATMPSGIYYARLTSEGFSETIKMMLLK